MPRRFAPFVPARRALLLCPLSSMLPAARAQTAALGVQPRALVFPADFGAHPDTRIEWWYITGALWPADALPTAQPMYGFQVTFFRTRTGLAERHPSAFAARQLVFAHAALTDLPNQRLRHDDRLAREGFGIARAAGGDTDLALRDWRLARADEPAPSIYRTQVVSRTGGFAFDFTMRTSQPMLLQGDAGYSRKGPQVQQASHYYSQPQLAVAGVLTVDGAQRAVRGTAWLDHEWSNELLDREAVGWDWIGINLLDGGALTAFRLRRADGSALWAGGSHRAGAAASSRNFGSDEVVFAPGATWRSAATGAAYPVRWRVRTPAGSFDIRPLLDAQELDSRASTGTVYWEGLSECLDERGALVGRGYLEMTGYAQRLRL
jgi:predicted secreted hydrolase